MRLNLILSCIILALPVGLFAEQPLTFKMAWERVQANSPTLSAAYAQMGVRQAELVQAGSSPNPLFAVIGENNTDIHEGHSFLPDTVTASISQPIELAGKRGLRQELAEQLVNSADWEEEAIKVDLYYTVANAFINVAAAQESIYIYQRQLETAQEIHQATTERVSENRLDILAQYKADVHVRTCSTAHLKACREFDLAKKELAALWGSDCPDFSEVHYSFYVIEEPTELCLLTHKLQQHPKIVKWNYQIAAARKGIALEQAQQTPDIVITGGVRNQWWKNASNTSLVIGFAVPLPIFDRNQGNIDKAHSLCCQAESEQAEALLALKSELIGLYKNWHNAYDTATCVRNAILPQAQLCVDTAKDGYLCGKYAFYELLDSQQTLFSTYQNYVDSLVDYHHAKNNIKRLTCYQEIYE
jgi:cobalt-zinc-cadmium efflux system outer membrane protein